MFLENTIDEGDGEERIVWEHEGVTFILLREDRKSMGRQGEVTMGINKGMERNWCWKYKLRYVNEL